MNLLGQELRYRRSLASRVALLTTVAFGLALVAVAVGGYLTARSQMKAALDESLLERAESAASARYQGQFQLPSWALGAADVKIAFIDPDGNVQSADAGPAIELGRGEYEVLAGQRDHYFRTAHTEEGDFRVVTVPTSGDRALVIAQSMRAYERTLAKFGAIVVIFSGLGVVTAALAGWLVARSGLRPVRRLTAAVEELARRDDLTPLRVEGADEVARLSVAFNQLLAAVSAARTRQRQLIADASHELRTPLTSLRTNLDLLAQADTPGSVELSPDARRELLDDVSAQIEELTTLIGDLVELARDEPVAPVVEEVDLADVVDRALARVRRRAPSVSFEVRTSRWPVRGDAAALERAVTNLLDNAAKWSPDGGTVTVDLKDGTLSIVDRGPGIRQEDLPHVFDRFYRSPESRGMPGSGLGLSIVAQVAARHGGSVWAGNAPGGGALLQLTLPLAAPPVAGDARGTGEQGGVAETLVSPGRDAGQPGAGRPSTGSRRTPRPRPS